MAGAVRGNQARGRGEGRLDRHVGARSTLNASVDERLKGGPWYNVDGKQYGVPYQWGPNVLMYSTKVFKDPPTSWGVVFVTETVAANGGSRPSGLWDQKRVKRSTLLLGVRTHVQEVTNYFRSGLFIHIGGNKGERATDPGSNQRHSDGLVWSNHPRRESHGKE